MPNSSRQAGHSCPPRARVPHSGHAAGIALRSAFRAADQNGGPSRACHVLPGLMRRLLCRAYVVPLHFTSCQARSSTTMTQPTHPTLPINTAHVAAQFARRGALSEAQFLYGEISQRMLERLAYIKINPTEILDAGCGTATALPGLSARF